MNRILPRQCAKGKSGKLTLIFPLIVFIALPVRALAQAPQTRATTAKRPVFVTASFVDRNGLFIEDLQKSEVEILENGQPREIELMAKDELPTAYGILFDRTMIPEREGTERPGQQSVSASVAARDLSYQLIDKLLGRQALWIGLYDQQTQIVFEADGDGFGAKNAISQMRGARGTEDSFLYSSLFSAVEKMNRRHERRRVIILFTQYIDSRTAGRLKALKNLLASSDVEFFPICFARRTGSAGGMHSVATTSSLKDLAQVTAGSAFFTMDYGDHLEDIARRLLDQLRTLYTFGINSQTQPSDFGKLEIKCSRPNSKVKCHPMVPDIE